MSSTPVSPFPDAVAIPMSHILSRPRKEPDWIIPGLLKRENVMFVIGRPKLGKSWLLMNLAWDLAEGKPVWGIRHSKEGYLFTPPRKMRVVYFAQEDTEDDLQDRLIPLQESGRVPTDNLLFVPKDLKLLLGDIDEGGWKLWATLRHASEDNQDKPIDLVIFDPLRRMITGDENSSKTTADLWRVLDALGQEFHCSFVFAHHIVKPPRDKHAAFDETSPFAGRGSGDIFAGFDASVNVTPVAQRGAMQRARKLRLDFTTKRGREISPVQVRLDLPPGSVAFEQFGCGRPVEEKEKYSLPTL